MRAVATMPEENTSAIEAELASRPQLNPGRRRQNLAVSPRTARAQAAPDGLTTAERNPIEALLTRKRVVGTQPTLPGKGCLRPCRVPLQRGARDAVWRRNHGV